MLINRKNIKTKTFTIVLNLKQIFYFKKMTTDLSFEQIAYSGMRVYSTFLVELESFICYQYFTLNVFISNSSNLSNNILKDFRYTNNFSENCVDYDWFIKFLSENKIFFSSPSTVDDFWVNELVMKYNCLSSNDLVKKFDLSEDFFLDQEKLEQQVHDWFWGSIPYKDDRLYNIEDLYIDDIIVPYSTNEYLFKTVEATLHSYNPSRWQATWKFINTHYYEVFHFLRDIKDQPMFDYWTLMFLWYWTLFFEELIFDDPNQKLTENPQHPFPPMSYWATPRETKYAYQWLQELIKFLDSILNLNFIVQFSDFSSFNFDKNFGLFWHYYVGSYQSFDFMYDYNMINWLQKLWTQLINPIIQVPSIFTTSNDPHFTSYEKTFYMSIFPDTLISRGWFNTFLDYGTPYYNNFFHAGFTFIDNLSLLEMWRYQNTLIAWGRYESFFEDFIVYQSAYLSDQFQAMRVALISVLLKQPWSIRVLDSYIYTYNSLFYFTLNPEYEHLLKAKILFPLSWVEWLSLFYEEGGPEQWMHQIEWLVCLLYGYNVSNYITNHPDWYIGLRRSVNAYEYYGCHTDNDENWELFQEWLLKAYTVDWTFSSFPLTMHLRYGKLSDYTDYFYNNNFIKFLNEKFYDDIGFFFTSIMWADTASEWTPYLNFNNLIFSYLSNYPFINETWSNFYPIIKLFNLNILEPDWRFYYFNKVDLFLIKEWLSETIEIGYKETLVREAFMWHWNVINFAANCPRYIGFYFTIWLDKILNLFFDKKSVNSFLNSKLFYPLHFFIYSNKSTFEIITKEQLIEFFFFFRKLLDDRFLVIKIFDENLQSYFDFIYTIYKSPIFQYFFELIFFNIFSWNKPLVGVSTLEFKNYPLKVAMVDFIDCRSWPLALEFYLPFLIWPESDYIIKDTYKIHLPFNKNLSEYFYSDNLTFTNYLEKIITLIMINDLLIESNKFDNDNLHKFLCVINSINIDWVQFNEFDRYLNYVVKKNLYHDSSYKTLRSWSVEENETNIVENNIKNVILDNRDKRKDETYESLQLGFLQMCFDELKEFKRKIKNLIKIF